jgi:DNA polymerase-3 subunit alpha
MMAHKLAGYTWGEVDKFRKAVGKKIPEEMAKQREQFIEGCIKHSGWTRKRGEEIWAWIEPFAAYGFNKAHSVSYGRVAYITAYLKANFGPEYMSAVLTHESGDVEKVAQSVAECKRMGIEVLPPNINESFGGFTVIPKDEKNPKAKIRFGLTTIKNFGEGIALSIIEERKKGMFTSLEDFLTRVQDRNLNKKSLESLVKAGAFDEFKERGILLSNIDTMLEFNKEVGKQNKDQTSLFGAIEDSNTLLRFNESDPIDKKTILAYEKELLGLYISGHPLDKFREKMEKKGVSINKVKEEAKNGQSVFVVGICTELKEIYTKKGDLMAFAKIGDYHGSIEAVLFPKTYEEAKKQIGSDQCLAIEGTISERNGEKSILVNKVKEL